MRFNEIVEAWSEKYKRSIDCSKPRGFSQRAHCAGRKKRGIKEFAPDSGGGRWYSDSEMMDIVGKGWDTSTDSNLFAEQLIMDAQDWLDKMGYDVRVIDVKRGKQEVYWYIEGRLFKNKKLNENPVQQQRLDALIARADQALVSSGLRRDGFRLVKDTPRAGVVGSITPQAQSMVQNLLNQAAVIAQQFRIQPSPDPVQTVAPSSVTNADFGVNEDSGKRRTSK